MPIDYALGVNGLKPGVCTSSTRPAAPYEGQLIYETDTDRFWFYNGSSWVWCGGKAPRVSVFRTAAQSVSTGSNTLLTWNSENVDTDSMHDNSTNPSRLTIPTGFLGRWRFDIGVTFAAAANGTRAAWITVNGAGTRYGQPEVPGSSVASAGLYISRELVLAVGDYVEVYCYQDSGGALNVLNSTTASYFDAQYVGAN